MFTAFAWNCYDICAADEHSSYLRNAEVYKLWLDSDTGVTVSADIPNRRRCYRVVAELTPHLYTFWKLKYE